MAQEVVQLHDKIFEPYISETEIKARIQELANEIGEDMAPWNPVFVSVLNGAFLFAADLIRNLDFQCEIEFVKFSSYKGMESSGDVKTLVGFNEYVQDRHVVILEDIVDTGRTINKLIGEIKRYSPLSIQIATLTFKKDALKEPVDLDYVGFEVPNEFIVGYGLDYDQLGRNLKGIYKLKRN